MNAGRRLKGVLKSAAGKNSGKVANLNDGEIYENQVRRDAAFHEDQDCWFGDNQARQHQQCTDLKHRSGDDTRKQMQYDCIKQNAGSFAASRFIRTLGANRKCNLNVIIFAPTRISHVIFQENG